ncbi:MAG: T9SS type A sorting domain-containing protein [Myroides sp.]
MKKLLLSLAFVCVASISATAQTTISQTGGGAVAGFSLSCTTTNQQNQPTGMSDNTYYRVYTMSSALNIVSVNVGAAGIDYAQSFNGFPLTVKLYKSNSAFPGSYPTGLTQLATTTFSVPKSQVNGNQYVPKTVNVPFSTPILVASGDIIVAEVSMPVTLGALFYIGAIATTGNETAPAYVKTTGCSISNPITMAAAAAQHNLPTLNGKIVIDLIGQDPASSEHFFTENFNLYPNPATDVLNISSKNGLEMKEIRITDMTGKVVKVQKDVSTVNVSNLAAGTYLIDITTNVGKATSKFIKK